MDAVIINLNGQEIAVDKNVWTGLSKQIQPDWKPGALVWVWAEALNYNANNVLCRINESDYFVDANDVDQKVGYCLFKAIVIEARTNEVIVSYKAQEAFRYAWVPAGRLLSRKD